MGLRNADTCWIVFNSLGSTVNKLKTTDTETRERLVIFKTMVSKGQRHTSNNCKRGEGCTVDRYGRVCDWTGVGERFRSDYRLLEAKATDKNRTNS